MVVQPPSLDLTLLTRWEMQSGKTDGISNIHVWKQQQPLERKINFGRPDWPIHKTTQFSVLNQDSNLWHLPVYQLKRRAVRIVTNPNLIVFASDLNRSTNVEDLAQDFNNLVEHWDLFICNGCAQHLSVAWIPLSVWSSCIFYDSSYTTIDVTFTPLLVNESRSKPVPNMHLKKHLRCVSTARILTQKDALRQQQLWWLACALTELLLTICKLSPSILESLSQLSSCNSRATVYDYYLLQQQNTSLGALASRTKTWQKQQPQLLHQQPANHQRCRWNSRTIAAAAKQLSNWSSE